MERSEPALGNTAGDGTHRAAWGMAGGKDGLPHRYRLRARGRDRLLKTKETGIQVQPGDVFLIESAGGGGWGNPLCRRRGGRAAGRGKGLPARRDLKELRPGD